MKSKFLPIVSTIVLGCFYYSLYRFYKWIIDESDKEEIKSMEEENSEQSNNETKKPDALEESDDLVDDQITIQTLISEDPLYNNFKFNEIRSVMKALTLEDFKDVFKQLDITDDAIVNNMFRVWDYDQDGYVSIRDFVHTFAYALRSTEKNHLMYIFDSCDLNNDGVLSTEEVQKCIYFVLKMDPSVEPEMLEELTIQHTRNVGMNSRLNVVFEQLHIDMMRGISREVFLSKGQFLRENLNIMSIFGLSLVEGLSSEAETEAKE
ncbi:LOW QUALITY PROTEIN: uncharacterized protein [Blastocystis hominis]|uniref:EF-hand domain-containing protein n=1 Tax=Blastocystis hominis TaxID=12968 RepID=D8M024_BLAHO|nr:LOW QUALITY PROTEIN: uncharacterized protein [Blastocystis hominis]CBK21413.2 unnamed protein product [Blastocystis hominis]|eukprot:XP_012895461.1 LOW QUALITY PROTEIN: uncharacterized protein [Blastocystis hominis]